MSPAWAYGGAEAATSSAAVPAKVQAGRRQRKRMGSSFGAGGWLVRHEQWAHRFDSALRRLRTLPTRGSRPVPNRARVPGSGIAAWGDAPAGATTAGLP